MRNVFASCGCCNKWPINLVVWRNNRNLLSYSSWDQKSKISLLKLKSRFQQGYKLSGDSRESSPHLFQCLVTVVITWPYHSSVCLHLHMAFSSMCLSFPSVVLLYRYVRWHLAPIWMIQDNLHCKTLNYICQKILPYKLILTGSRNY